MTLLLILYGGQKEGNRLITIDELFSKKLLYIPEPDAILSSKQIKEGCKFEGRGGVYIFYNRFGEALYVGISNDVGKRVKEHFGSPKGNRDLMHYINQGKPVYVYVFYEDDKVYQEVYEAYLIKVLNPRFNVGKTGRKKV